MEAHTSSFRDPSGFVIRRGSCFLRVVNPVYQPHYELLMQSGLYQKLVAANLLVPHEELPIGEAPVGAYKVLRPQQVEFISYPYEWCFTQWKETALATLSIQRTALDHGMTLKDASAYNIQFMDGKPVLIDTLSFETLKPGEPWVAYHQFCRHFLGPLALMAYRDVRLGQLLRVHLDGIPLDLAQKLLPGRSRLSFWLLLHIHLHARSHRRTAGKDVKGMMPKRQLPLASLRGLVESLQSAVRGLRWSPPKEVWGQYYTATVTGGRYLEHKQQLVRRYLGEAKPGYVWDLGCNTGLFSLIAAEMGARTVGFDGDPDCVEMAYLDCFRRKEKRLLPLLMDLANPSPAMGWENTERQDWLSRGQPDLVMALAVVHHLAIGNNVPLPRIVNFFCRLGKWLIVEFVPKDDPNARKLLQVREDIFSDYTEERFKEEFGRSFTIEQAEQVQDSSRVLYLMRRK